VASTPGRDKCSLVGLHRISPRVVCAPRCGRLRSENELCANAVDVPLQPGVACLVSCSSSQTKDDAFSSDRRNLGNGSERADQEALGLQFSQTARNLVSQQSRLVFGLERPIFTEPD
jgi:hypothetical protein